MNMHVKVLDGKSRMINSWLLFMNLMIETEWDKEECWIKANPGLGTIKKFDFFKGLC